MLHNRTRVTQAVFRMLVFGIFVSILYDLFYMALASGDSAKSDSGVETNVKSFSFAMLYLSFFTRLLMALIYWKDSLDFHNIIGGSSV